MDDNPIKSESIANPDYSDRKSKLCLPGLDDVWTYLLTEPSYFVETDIMVSIRITSGMFIV
jgi:hypothetical protein